MSVLIIRGIRDERVACAMADVQHRDDAITLIDRIDYPVDVLPAPIKQMTEAIVFGNDRTTGRVLIEA